MKRTAAEIITTLIERQGITTVSGIPGGSNLPLYDALGQSKLRHILARHEQGAAFIAMGMARATRRAQVCIATSGPGATNLLTAIADAKADSTPLVAITGQVPSTMIGTDAFQEANTVALARPITKAAWLIESPEELLDIIPRAFSLAQSGRPGPVLIDIPKDIQKMDVEFDAWPEPGKPQAPPEPDESDINRLAEAIRHARRPILYLGGGVISSGAARDAGALARRCGLPVVSSLMGLGAFPADDPMFLGMLGMHGSRRANLALEQCDLLLAVGARFNDRTTGRINAFCTDATVAHIDIDARELGKIRAPQIAIRADARLTLEALLPRVASNERAEWLREIHALGPDPLPTHPEPTHPISRIRQLADCLGDDATIATDVGQHQMWAAITYPHRRPSYWLTSGGLGTMGFGLPVAIGAALARPDAPTICVTGDGSFMMNIQELATLAETRANVKIFLMNNGHLGLVRQQQELFFDDRTFAVKFESQTDFTAIARGFGIPAVRLDESSDSNTLSDALKQPGPMLIECPIEWRENVYPMVPPGGANKQMLEGFAVS